MTSLRGPCAPVVPGSGLAGEDPCCQAAPAQGDQLGHLAGGEEVLLKVIKLGCEQPLPTWSLPMKGSSDLVPRWKGPSLNILTGGVGWKLNDLR